MGDLLQRAKRPLVAIEAQILRREAYDTRYGIYNHSGDLDDKRPYAVVEYHWKEDTYATSFLHERLKMFIELKINTLFGYTPNELFQLPRHVVDTVFQVAKRELLKEHKKNTDNVQTLNMLHNDLSKAKR